MALYTLVTLKKSGVASSGTTTTELKSRGRGGGPAEPPAFAMALVVWVSMVIPITLLLAQVSSSYFHSHAQHMWMLAGSSTCVMALLHLSWRWIFRGRMNAGFAALNLTNHADARSSARRRHHTMALSEQGSVTSSDHPFSLIDALDDDVLSLVLASLGVRWLGAVAQACRRTRSHSRDTVLLRKVLHHALTAHQWRVREDQLLHLPLASVLLLLRQPPDSAPLKRLDATRLPRKLSVSEDGVSARFLGERLGGNRCVRACAPLPVAAYHALRPPRAPPALPPASPPRSDRRSEGSNAASDGGDGGGGGRLGLRLGPPPAAGFQLERGCCIGYFEVAPPPSP